MDDSAEKRKIQFYSLEMQESRLTVHDFFKEVQL
jgi:hypothetical protein